MVAASRTPSPQLLEANRRLRRRRGKLQKPRTVDRSLAQKEKVPASTAEAESSASAHRYRVLPAHLGWESENLSQALRRAQDRQEAQLRRARAQHPDWLLSLRSAGPQGEHPDIETGPPATYQKPCAIKLYPDLALAMLRQEMEAAGRIWLLLRQIDEEGRGWVNIEQARNMLTKRDSALRVCGWRQLRNLLRQGQGVFWERDKQRIWLRSNVKVAIALDVSRLTGKPVDLPVSVLCSGIGEIRAHFYASFHSGRTKQDGKSQAAAPIARATLEEVTGVAPRTQREYEKRVGVDVRENYAIGEQKTQAALQEQAWERGRAIFTLIDRKGIHGRKNAEYVAWQLPNSYAGPHEQRARGRQRQLNRQLADLRDRRDAGNDQGQDQDDRRPEHTRTFRQARPPCRARRGGRLFARRYYENGGAAGKAYNRDPRSGCYWKGRSTVGDKKLWYELAGQNK